MTAGGVSGFSNFGVAGEPIAPGEGWQTPKLGRFSKGEEGELAERLRQRTIEQLGEKIRKRQTKSTSPRLGSPRERRAYEALRRGLHLLSPREQRELMRRSLGSEWSEELVGLRLADAEESKLNRIRDFARSKAQELLEQGRRDAYLLSPEDLVHCGLSPSYPSQIRVLPVAQTLLFREAFIAQGGQKTVFGSREFLIEPGYWSQTVVEYECDAPIDLLRPRTLQCAANFKSLSQFLSQLGLSENFPPPGKLIGRSLSGNKLLFKQDIRFEGTALNIDPRAEFRRALGVYRDAALALDYLHRNGVLHRDIKGQNIFVQGGRGCLADLDDSCYAENTVDLVDTWTHAAPELAAVKARNTYASDLWAFGMTLWQGFYARYHTESSDPQDLAATMPPFAEQASRKGYIRLACGLAEMDEKEMVNGMGFPSMDSGLAEQRIRQLILDLLRKDPGKRLTSTQVIQQLERAIELV